MNLTRRKMLLLVGGGAVVAAGGIFGYSATRTPQTAHLPWQRAGTYSDPRMRALSWALLAPNPHNRQPWLVDLAEEGVITLYADLERMLYHADEPFFAPGLSGAWQRLRAAGDQGIRVIFEGHGGDELLFCTARNRLHELARKHQWLTFGQELHAVVPLIHAKAWQVAWPYIYHYALGRRPSKRVSDKDPRGSHSSRRSEEALRSSSALLNADFARQIGLANRPRRVRITAAA